MTHQNHVDGEIYAPIPGRTVPTRVPVEPTDLDYRIAALNAAVNHHKNIGGNLILHAKHFERYLRGEAA